MAVTVTPDRSCAPTRAPTSPLRRAERLALVAVAIAIVGFGWFGFATGSPSTVGYLVTTAGCAAAVALRRREPLPATLAAALAALSVGHLAGGLVPVGGDVLYNADPGFELLQYDHVFHASASAVAVVLLHRHLRDVVPGGVRSMLAVALLGGLGAGALNELVEFLATLAHDGTHVGGYLNTGWDLVANTVGAATGAAIAWLGARLHDLDLPCLSYGGPRGPDASAHHGSRRVPERRDRSQRPSSRRARRRSASSADPPGHGHGAR
jgi:hypothetical protein